MIRTALLIWVAGWGLGTLAGFADFRRAQDPEKARAVYGKYAAEVKRDTQQALAAGPVAFTLGMFIVWPLMLRNHLDIRLTVAADKRRERTSRRHP